jgi:hypothetical protein
MLLERSNQEGWHGRDKRLHGYNGRNHSEDLGVGGRIILNGRYEGAEWIHLAKDRAQWRAHLNTAVNLLVSQKAGNFLTAERMLISQGLSFTELLL